MNEEQKLEYPNFIKVNSYVKTSNPDDGYLLVKTRINPMSITSYFSMLLSLDGVNKDITGMHVGGSVYYIDMTIEQVDNMMDAIDRTLSISM